MSAICLTAGDCAENHVGMQKVGTAAASGFAVDDLYDFLCKFIELDPDLDYELVRLDYRVLPDSPHHYDPAALLIIRGGVDTLIGKGGHKKLMKELEVLDWDKKYLDTRFGGVKNKHARYNLVFSDKSQTPDYEKGKGRIYAYSQLPTLKKWYQQLAKVMGNKVGKLAVEGNYYYDVDKTGIGWHGDAERKKVVAASLGSSRELHYVWHLGKERISDKIEFTLNGGDMYVMSEKTSGFDYLKVRKRPTLRHAAGRKNCKAEKYIK